MKILVVATTFPRWEQDTEPSFVYYLCKQLKELGAEVTVIVPHAYKAQKSEVMCGVKIKRMAYFFPFKYQRLFYNGGALPNLKSSFLAKIQLPLFLLLLPFYMYSILKKEKFDLIHCHWLIPQGFISILLGKLFKIPVISSAHAGDVFIAKFSLVRFFLKKVIKNSHSITVNSIATSKAVTAIYDKETYLIPMGVSIDLFSGSKNSKETITSKYNLSNNENIILSVGRFAEKKGLEYLIKAMPIILEEINNIKLLLVGFGPEEKKLKLLVEKLKLSHHVVFCGKIPNGKLADYYNAANVFVLPSIHDRNGDTEGLGVVLLEAIAANCPIVGSNVGGITDIIIDNKTGLLAEQKNERDLAEKVIKVIKNDKLNDKLVNNARKHLIENFTWEAVGSKFYTLFRDIIKHRKNAKS
jgi:glycosyltransferase involved in cell wall biosynthesis